MRYMLDGPSWKKSRAKHNFLPIRRILHTGYVLTHFPKADKLRRMVKELTVSEMAPMGGRARSKMSSKRQIKGSGKRGGRRPKLNERDWARLFYMLRAGKTQVECARQFKITTRTIGRALAMARAKLRSRSSR